MPGLTPNPTEIDIESGIDVSSTWGVGDLAEDKRPGVSDVRVKVEIEGDVIKWYPIANTYTRPANLTSELV